jgi:hypothetical protein
MPKKFQKKIEDFTCEFCGNQVTGTGYTNHCPKCLYSKHVDINPGDRMEACGGLMKPISYDFEKQEYIIIHACQTCGAIKRNKMSVEDNFDELLKLTKRLA